MGWNNIWSWPVTNKTVPKEQNKKVRLLVTADCPNRCPKCCNRLYNLDTVPVIDRWDYEEFNITGGEPSLFEKRIKDLVEGIREIQDAQGISSKIFIYTSKINMYLPNFLLLLDGITYTPHSSKDIKEFIDYNNRMLKSWYLMKDSALPSLYQTFSFRLNLFPEIEKLLHQDIDLGMWNVKHMTWQDNCPIPKGEDFRRIKDLWKKKE